MPSFYGDGIFLCYQPPANLLGIQDLEGFCRRENAYSELCGDILDGLALALCRKAHQRDSSSRVTQPSRLSSNKLIYNNIYINLLALSVL